MSEAGCRIEIRGTVQGVGFRPWIYRLARENGIGGRVSNDSRGVTIEAFGTDEALAEFLKGIRASPPPAARIRELECRVIASETSREFVIVASRRSPGLEVSIPPDLATCDDCLARGPRSRGPPVPLPVHQLHQLRPALHDRLARALRPRGDDHGRVPDVRGLPPRVRRSTRSPVSRAAQCVPRVRPRPDRRRAVRRASRGIGSDPGRRPRAGGRADRGGQGPRRFSPRVRRDVGRERSAPAPPQEPRGKAPRRHGGEPGGGRSAGGARAGRARAAGVAGAADRARPPASRHGARCRASRPATR